MNYTDSLHNVNDIALQKLYYCSVITMLLRHKSNDIGRKKNKIKIWTHRWIYNKQYILRQDVIRWVIKKQHINIDISNKSLYIRYKIALIKDLIKV